MNEALLDNPIWHSLTTNHADLALGAQTGSGQARRYPADVGPLCGLREPTPEAWADLAALMPEGDAAVLFLQDRGDVPDDWELVRGGPLVQMVCREMPEAAALEDAVARLGPEDIQEMMALAALTEPGPFRRNTARLGGFVGIRVAGRLAAMAGRRTAPPGFVEISAVCTDPDFRGRGYAKALVTEVARNIHREGSVPFLTSFEANGGAIRAYEQVGFSVRRGFELAAVKPPLR